MNTPRTVLIEVSLEVVEALDKLEIAGDADYSRRIMFLLTALGEKKDNG